MADVQYQDLLKDSSKPWPDNKDYFELTITDLDPDSDYPIELRWVYKDEKTDKGKDWSVVKLLQTPAETTPNAPRLQSGDVIAAPGLIKVNWDGKDYLGNTITRFDRIEVYVQDAVGNPSTVFGDGTKPVTFFKSAGTLTIAAPAGTYTVFLKTVNLSGKKSSASASFTITVESGVVIEDPTLPNGLSVATTAFGLTVTWAGTYTNNDTFTGFKSIDLYATTTNLGASTTTGLTSSNIVGNLTINDTVNKLNIGLEILKQVTGTNSTTVYTTGVYLYYIAKNANDVVYKVSGTPTYTRINSTSITPSKANKIDLENGVISIENLVAGNGQFTTWLRAGTAGGSRIELNGGSSFVDNGYSVLPGLSVYSTGGTPIFRASLDGVVSFGGYTPSDITTIQNTANGKNTIFRQATVPSAIAANDIWVNTYNGTLSSGGNSYQGNNTIFVSNAAGTGGWVLSKDQDITNVVNKTVNFNSGGNIVGPIQIPVNTGSIYSSKSSYGNSTSGWFLGYNGTTPVIDIGSGDAYMRWDGSSLSIKGNVDATTGTIGGWSIGTTALTGGTLTLNSSGTITSTGTSTNWYGATANVTSTFSSGLISLYTNDNTVAVGGFTFGNLDNSMKVYNNTNKTSINSVGFVTEATSPQNGVGVGGFGIYHASGDYDIHFNLYGALDANNLTQKRIVFDHWNGRAAQRAKDNAAATYDTLSQNLRPLVIDGTGTLFIGATSYFSTTQTTTPSNSTGANGDLYYSTA